MSIGVREKIFAGSLMAVSLLFLLFDQVYLKPKLNHAVAQIKISLAAGLDTIEALKKQSADAASVKLLVDHLVKSLGVEYYTIPHFLIQSGKKYSAKEAGYQTKNMLAEALAKGRALGEFIHHKKMDLQYGLAVKGETEIAFISRSLTVIHDEYEAEKTCLIGLSLISLIVAYLYAHVLSAKILKR